VHPMQGFAEPPAQDDDVIDVEYRSRDEGE